MFKQRVAVEKSMIEEFGAGMELGALKQRERKGCANLMDSRCVIRWKRQPDGSWGIKSRLCIMGLKDLQQDWLDTFSATASRQGQRVVGNVEPSLGCRAIV